MSDRTPEHGAGGDRFVGRRDTMEDTLKMETVGLVRLEDFQRKREELLAHRERESTQGDRSREEKRARRRKEQARSAAALSFSLDEDEDGAAAAEAAGAAAAPPPQKKRRERSVRNPEVDTSFLPDRERDAAERREREELREEWHARQAQLKQEHMHVDFVFWDGSAHPGALDATKGELIGAFAERCRAAVPALRNVPADRVMFVKDDLIVPHHYSFYDMITRDVHGKSGAPLFGDGADGGGGAAAAKVVDRTWYQRNKHIYPANRWEVYDPAVHKKR